LPGVAYPGVRDNRSTLNTKTGYDDDDEIISKTVTSFTALARASYVIEKQSTVQ